MPIFYRWVPKNNVPTVLAQGMVSHKDNKPLWVFQLEGTYRPGNNITKSAILIAFDVADSAAKTEIFSKTLDYEDDSYKGENKHPDISIVKANEKGAVGIGVNVLAKLATTNVRTRLATLDEVAKALGLKLKEAQQKTEYRYEKAWT